MAYTIIHDRENCIGCKSCAIMNKKDWKMEGDAKSTLLCSKEVKTGFFEKELEKHFELNLEVAQSCPVNVIHIKKDDKDII